MFSYKNNKGRVYYLHKKGRLYYFSAKQKDSIELPEDYKIIEHNITGLPMLKKQ